MKRENLLDIHENTVEQCLETMKAKNADYADDSGALSNFKASEVIGVDAAKGILMRSMDKFKRIQSFVERGDLKVEDEPVEDAIHDVINYMILLKALLIDRQEIRPEDLFGPPAFGDSENEENRLTPDEVMRNYE